jgi:cytochrome c oxidase cbb3-type subunit 2
MPSYPFLFQVVEEPARDDVTVPLPPDYAPENGVVIARPDALDLVQYLRELDRTYPVDVLPVSGEADE